MQGKIIIIFYLIFSFFYNHHVTFLSKRKRIYNKQDQIKTLGDTR